jgi:hypothetical protein
MESEKVKKAIEICTGAFATLEDAKTDCKYVVESAMDALCGIDETTPKEIRKGIHIEHKDEIRSIKKIAKALATGKLETVAAESNSIAEMVDAFQLNEKPF